MFFTTCYLISVQFIEPKPKGSHRASRNNRMWKYTQFFFTHALFMECIITPYFWSALWPAIKIKPDTINHPLKWLGGQLNHSVPLSCLVFDWMLLSAKPFVKRHFALSLFIAIFYLFVNFSFTKITGVPVYPAMTWKGTKGYLVPLAFIPGGFFIYAVLYYLTYFKLKFGFHN